MYRRINEIKSVAKKSHYTKSITEKVVDVRIVRKL